MLVLPCPEGVTNGKAHAEHIRSASPPAPEENFHSSNWSLGPIPVESSSFRRTKFSEIGCRANFRSADGLSPL